MKQVVVIRGGTTFNQYEDYIESLRTKSVQIDRIAYAPGWKESLQAKLGQDYLVLIPSMPNTANAKYTEWKMYFDRVAEVLEDDCILVGHSMGGIFLAKYLSECKFPRRIAATILVAAPFDDDSEEDLGDFKISTLSELFTEQAGRVIVFGAHDDPVISPSDFDRYRDALPHADIQEVSAPDHYVRPEFPELVEAIKSVHRDS